MRSTPILSLPPARRPVRKPWLAAGLSLLLPGVGLLYVGAILPALGMLSLWVIIRPLLALLLAAGAFDLRPWWYADLSVDLALRAVAAVVSFAWARRTHEKPLPVVPPGVYGLSLLGALLLRMLASQQLQSLVPVIELSADAYGLRQGEYVQVRKAPPVTGLLGVYLYDTADAGPQNPAAPTRRGAYVGRVGEISEAAVTIDGLDASIPVGDFLGEALGVVLSKSDDRFDWSRVGTKPRLP